MWNMVSISFIASEEMPFENVDGQRRRTTDAYLYYKLTYEPLKNMFDPFNKILGEKQFFNVT